MRVLVVDDEPVALTMVGDALRSAGFEVVTATNGVEAMAIMRASPCRIVVSDWLMPEMDGLALCRAMRKPEWPGYIYFIIVTARDSAEDTIDGLEAGADDFLAKPFNTAELVMRVKTGRRVVALQTREVTIFALAKLAESRDPETGEHLERVQRYSKALAQRLRQHPRFAEEIDDDFLRLIYLTSPLHDIGKVAIPDSVLLKPGRLTDAEFNIMKTHTLRGAETLAAAMRQCPEAAFLQMGHDIAMSHHEKFDGSGYPRGIAGDDIPLAARIVALADVYDALTSRRVYKAAFSHGVAISIIQSESGSHFDPDIVDAFIAEEPRFRAIDEEFRGVARAA